MPEIKQLISIAEIAAREAGRQILGLYDTPSLTTSFKQDNSPVTNADRLSHSVITSYLLHTGIPILSEEGAAIPYAVRESWEWLWSVDPLDGTKEFIQHLGEFTVNIALIYRQLPIAGVVYIPVADTLYSGDPDSGMSRIQQGERISIRPASGRPAISSLMQRKGVTIITSRSHQSAATRAFIGKFNAPIVRQAGSSLKFIELIEGRAAVYPRLEPSMEWDTAAGHALLGLGNRNVYQMDLSTALLYNKPDLMNPSFVAF